jgi:hypothetical protein
VKIVTSSRKPELHAGFAAKEWREKTNHNTKGIPTPINVVGGK